MTFESSVVSEDWGSVVIITLYKGKGERTECKIYKGINLLSVVGKIHAGILGSRVCRVTKGLIIAVRGYVNQIFTLKQLWRKHMRKTERCMCFMDLEKAYGSSKFQSSNISRCVLGESGSDIAEGCRKVVSGRKVARTIRSLVNASVCEGAA